MTVKLLILNIKPIFVCFQTAQNLTLPDGKYGDQTHTALMAAVADNDVGQRTEPDPEPEQLSMMKVKIVCDNGTVNIRVGNGTDYARITAVPDGTECEWIATAQNGWYAVRIGSQVGWVSGKYSEITTA